MSNVTFLFGERWSKDVFVSENLGIDVSNKGDVRFTVLGGGNIATITSEEIAELVKALMLTYSKEDSK